MKVEALTGKLFDIQGYSVQDGPGIRTTAFMKGCPLRCPWCHSPESQSFKAQLSWMSMRCLGTDACDSRCIAACSKGAISLGHTREDVRTGELIQLVHVNRDICDDCGECTKKCYAGALSISGKDYTVDELVERLLKDKAFYETSGGGVTISGGEPLYQPEFVAAVLKKLKELDVHTALDTTGFVKWEVLQTVLPYTDLFLYDLKHMDSEKHKEAVGVPNELILDNARRIVREGGKLQVRIPVIPLFNHDIENIRKTAEFCVEIAEGIDMIQLLPYHNLGTVKYLRISDKPAIELTPPSESYMLKLKSIMEEYSLSVTIH